jgi:glutaminase
VLEEHPVLTDALSGQLVVPHFAEFSKEVETLWNAYAHDEDDATTDPISSLNRADEVAGAAAVATVDGQLATFGDGRASFTIQSVCKPVNYGLALEHHGREFVHSRVGREPSCLRYDAVALNSAGIPHNPMVNSGAIAICGLIDPHQPLAARVQKVQSTWARLTGGSRPEVNQRAIRLERQYSNRNFAIAHLLRAHQSLQRSNMADTVDLYLRACALDFSIANVAMAAATLANDGVCPSTGDRVFSSLTVSDCLSAMLANGLYEYSSAFLHKVGIPAKSGVSGALIAVVPGFAGVAVWSPKLDQFGNSLRGLDFCERLADRYSLHVLRQSDVRAGVGT